MSSPVEKVTAFIIRKTRSGSELLVLKHPYAGNQIPAGTLELGESLVQAALREACEESGLKELAIRRYLGAIPDRLPEAHAVTTTRATVFSRPDPNSFDWAAIPRGCMIQILRQEHGFFQVAYQESDQYPDPTYVSYQITGWVKEECLVKEQLRHYFLFDFLGLSADSWSHACDQHIFNLYWAPLNNLPAFVHPVGEWLDVLLQHEEGKSL